MSRTCCLLATTARVIARPKAARKQRRRPNHARRTRSEWSRATVSRIRESTRSMGYERLEHRTDIAADHQIRHVVKIGCFAVNDDELGAVALGRQREAGRRPYDEGGADGEEEVARRGEVARARHGVLGHRLAE